MANEELPSIRKFQGVRLLSKCLMTYIVNILRMTTGQPTNTVTKKSNEPLFYIRETQSLGTLFNKISFN